MYRRFVHSRIYSDRSVVITTINGIPLIDRPNINIRDLQRIPEEATLIGNNGYTLKLLGESYHIGNNLHELHRSINSLISYGHRVVFPDFRMLRVISEFGSIPILHRKFTARIYMIDYCDKIDHNSGMK
jgi:hypothetical protein